MGIKKESYKERKGNFDDISRFYIHCGRCDGDASAVQCRCICEDESCRGRKCGANKTIGFFKCFNCGWVSNVTDEADEYIEKCTENDVI